MDNWLFDISVSEAVNDLRILCCHRPQGSIDALYNCRQKQSSDALERYGREHLDWAILFGEFKYSLDVVFGDGTDHGNFLHLASRYKRHDLVREVVYKLRQDRVDRETRQRVVNKKSRYLGRTPLHEMVSGSAVGMAYEQTLLEESNLREKNYDGMTALHYAVIKYIKDIATGVQDIRPLRSVLDVAAKRGQLEHTVYVSDEQGRTPADLAVGGGQTSMLGFYTAALTTSGLVTEGELDKLLHEASTTGLTSIDKALLFRLLSPTKHAVPNHQCLLKLGFDAVVNTGDLPLALEFLPRMRLFLRDAFSDVDLTSPRVIKTALKMALRENSLSLVANVYELSSSSSLRKVGSKLRQNTLCLAIACDSDSLDSLTLLLDKDHPAISWLDSASLSTALQKAVASNAHSALASLCMLCDPASLRLVDPAILDDILHYVCKHRLTAILKETSIVELVGASVSQRTLEAQLNLLAKDLTSGPSVNPTSEADLDLVVKCTSKAVVRSCTAPLCGTIAHVFANIPTFSRHLKQVEELVKVGLLGKASLEGKRAFLIRAAECGGIELASACIAAGALHGFEKQTRPSPIDVAKLKGHDRLARMLQKALDDQNLLALGDQPVDSILLRIGGPPGAGKSTLVQSLKTSRLRGTFRKEDQPDEGIRNYLARTKGIKVHHYKDDSGSQYHVLDLGGHDDFAAAHQLFIGQGEVPTVNTIVISSLSEREDMLKETMKWCAFYASRYRPRLQAGQASSRPGLDSPQQPVVVVATRLAEADAGNRRNVIDSFGKAKQRYTRFLNFQDGPLFVDARKSWAEATRALRRNIAKVKESLLNRDLRQPALCRDVQRALPEIRKAVQRPIILREKLYAHFARAVKSSPHAFSESVLASHEEVFEAVLRKMSDAAEIVSFQKPSLKKYLVIEPQWLLSHIVGILMSPEHFPPPHVVYQHGRTKRALAEAAVDNPHVPGKETLEMVAQLGLCILEEEDMIAPSKLDTKRDVTTWIARVDLDIYFGIRFSCEHVPMSPALFPQLQVHLYNKFLDICGQVSKLWKDGIRLTLLNSRAEGLLEARRDQMAINISVRGSSSFPRDAYQLLQLLREQVLYMAEEFSPGSDMAVKILSSNELSTLADKGSIEAPLIAYKEQDVKDAMERTPRPIRSEDGTGEPEDPFSLMVLPSTHLLLMASTTRTRFCNVVNASGGSDGESCCWLNLSERLNLLDISQQITRATPNPTGELLDAWSRRSAQNTVERLLDVVKTLQHQEAVAILEEELREMTNETIAAYTASRESETQGPDSVGTSHRPRQPPTERPPDSSHPSSADGSRSDSQFAISTGTLPLKPGNDVDGNDLPTHTVASTYLPEKSTVVSSTTQKPPKENSSDPITATAPVAMPTPTVTSVAQSACATCTAELDAAVNVYYSPAEATSGTNLEHRATHAPQSSTSLQSRKTSLSEPTLMKIASSFFDFFDCKKLAVFLELDQQSGFVSSLQSANPHALPSKIAFAIMCQWVRENGSAATGPMLHSVLKDDLKMTSVAEAFERELYSTNLRASITPRETVV